MSAEPGGKLWPILRAYPLSVKGFGDSAGPATRPIGEFAIDLPRPRDVAEIRLSPRFIELHDRIWHAMKDEVLKGYQQTKNRVVA